jgi:hypothetical protein
MHCNEGRTTLLVSFQIKLNRILRRQDKNADNKQARTGPSHQYLYRQVPYCCVNDEDAFHISRLYAYFPWLEKDGKVDVNAIRALSSILDEAQQVLSQKLVHWTGLVL